MALGSLGFAVYDIDVFEKCIIHHSRYILQYILCCMKVWGCTSSSLEWPKALEILIGLQEGLVMAYVTKCLKWWVLSNYWLEMLYFGCSRFLLRGASVLV